MQKKGLLGARPDKNGFRSSTLALFFEPLFFCLHTSAFVVGEQEERSSSAVSLHRRSSWRTDESERSAGQRASALSRLRVKDVNRKPTNPDSHAAAL